MRILIADDNEQVRHGIAWLLSSEKEWQVCGEACSISETLDKTAELRPDLVLLDIRMPDGSGLDTARRLRLMMPELKIVIMSQHDPNRLASHAIHAGADACVDKARMGADLIPTISAVMNSYSPSGKLPS